MDNPTRQKLEVGTSKAAGEQGSLWSDMALSDGSTGETSHGLQAMGDEQCGGLSWDECQKHLCGCRWLATGEP